MSNNNSDLDLWKCNHNAWVTCRDGNCEKCGWNPVVAEARLEKIRSGHGNQQPETSE